jgi:hypothetical protein
MNVFDARMKTPFTCLIGGSPMSGKSTFVKRLLEQRWKLIDNEFDYLLWCYGQRTAMIDSLQNQTLGIPTTVLNGLPSSFSDYIQPQKRGLVILDDLMATAGESKEVTDLFCNKVQHANLSVILLMQNLFYHGKERTTFLRCAHYLVIFKNPLDRSTPLYLAQRVMPLQRKLFLNIFDAATDRAFGYLFIDGHQTTPTNARFRTNIFDDDGVQHVFVISSDQNSEELKDKKKKKKKNGTIKDHSRQTEEEKEDTIGDQTHGLPNPLIQEQTRG